MKKFFDERSYKKIHLVGIGGVSQSALAEYFLGKGITVSGSDTDSNEYVKRLKTLGVKIFLGHSPKNLDGLDLSSALVYTSAVKCDNPEIIFAKNKGIPVFSRSEVLGAIISKFPLSVGVSGSHGKTTSTSMLADILARANLSPTVFLGGNSKNFNNFSSGKGIIAVTEACEFERSFLDIPCNVAVVLNVDNDHLDTYGSIENEIMAFKEFCFNKTAFVNADDINASKIIKAGDFTFGLSSKARFRAKYLRKNPRGYSFTVFDGEMRLGRINLKVNGKYNIYNALSAISVAVYLGVDFSRIKIALENFCSVERRNEYLGDRKGVRFYADYAHHPAEIKAVCESYDDNTLFVFQPHTYSRTKLLLGDFVSALTPLKNLIIYKTYPAREKFIKEGDALVLFSKIKKERKSSVYYAKTPKILLKIIDKKFLGVEKVVFLGAGDIYALAKKFLVL